MSHEIEGPHALVGGELARRYKESEAVAHAMEAHHNEVELQTVEAVIVQIVDALSGARRARAASRSSSTSSACTSSRRSPRHEGVDKVYAMHAGREIRVIVHPDEIDDDAAALLSHQIAREVEKQLEYPGQIKVTVIRESRATDYASALRSWRAAASVQRRQPVGLDDEPLDLVPVDSGVEPEPDPAARAEVGGYEEAVGRSSASRADSPGAPLQLSARRPSPW